MTQGDQNAALLENDGEEMFCGATIQELTGLVDEVMRTYETPVSNTSLRVLRLRPGWQNSI